MQCNYLYHPFLLDTFFNLDDYVWNYTAYFDHENKLVRIK